MNIVIRELKTRTKSFLFWLLGVGALIYAGMVKYEGFTGAAAMDLTDFFDKFPKIILAMFGMVGIDITKVADYYTVIGFLVMICGAIFAMNLGAGIVTDEIVDKTADFLFTKPRTRAQVLTKKLSAAAVYLLLYSVSNFVISKIAVETTSHGQNIDKLILQYSVVILLVNLVFLSLSVFVTSLIRSPERGKTLINLLFLFFFVAGVAYDLLESAPWLRYTTPFRWFEAPALLKNGIDPIDLGISLGVTAILLLASYGLFSRKEV